MESISVLLGLDLFLMPHINCFKPRIRKLRLRGSQGQSHYVTKSTKLSGLEDTGNLVNAVLSMSLLQHKIH